MTPKGCTPVTHDVRNLSVNYHLEKQYLYLLLTLYHLKDPEHTTHDYLTGTLERTKPLMPGKLPRIKYSELNKSWRGSCPFWSSNPPRS